MKSTVLNFLILLTLCLSPFAAFGQIQPLSLTGQWRVRLDPDSVGEQQRFFDNPAGESITLPGTLDQAALGTPTSGADYGILSRQHKYIGQAWYSREIEIPRSWGESDVILYLERVMWRSQVWIDGQKISVQDGLGTPHYHSLGRLKPGSHSLVVCVNNDMIYNIGDKGHSYGEYTQIIWNGIIGRIELRPQSAVAISGLKIWPQAERNNVRITFDIRNPNRNKNAKLLYRITETATGRVVQTQQQKLLLTDTLIRHTADISLTESARLWDEFTPNLYNIEVELKSGKHSSCEKTSFGFRDVSASKSKILINKHPTYMRGNLDCVHFPLTGYPSCDVAEWERIFGIYKAYGMNQVRFHSWCPPEAAFEAADRMGIYIQAEVLWIDWWMAVVNPQRPEMTTRGLPKGLGNNPSADLFVQEELQRMIDAYGNHPSFVMMCIGNELGNTNFDIAQTWIQKLQQQDNRRIYSVSTARRIMPVDQFMVTHNIPQVGATYGLTTTGTDFDLEQNYSKTNIPIIAHEVGQYPVYPLWSEIDKYKGVLRARNLDTLKMSAQKNHIQHMDTAFHQASGALQTLLYKANIETLQRTSSCAGFNMLSMTDYSGQGEALVGWLDSFWNSKNIVSPKKFRGYANDIVILARFEKYVWQDHEQFTTRIQIANYGKENIIKRPLRWTLNSTNGTKIALGTMTTNAPQGQLSSAGTIEIQMPTVTHAQKLTLTATYPNTDYNNSWDIWLFPQTESSNNDILVTEQFDDQAQQILQQGGKVLLIAHKLGSQENITPLNFAPLFWSNSFFPGQSNKTLGLYINSNHPSLAAFPTQSHTDWQWQSLCNGRSFILNNHPKLKPIVQPISDFHINDKLASIFECRVGNGKLLVSGHNLQTENIEAKALKNSLLEYMQSAEFDPQYTFDNNELQQLFYSPTQVENQIPKGFENAALYICCAELTTTNGSVTWDKSLDNIRIQEKGCDYQTSCDSVWKDNHGAAWTAREITIEIKTPNGIIGDLYVKFEDPNNQARQGILTLEGRETILEKSSTDGQWVKLFVMREDTNDGRIIFKAKTTTANNLMISQVALIKN